MAPPATPRPPPGERARARRILRVLTELYPDIETALDHTDAYQLLVATILSAQSTDVMVNKVTPVLFEAYPTVEALAAAEPADVERIIYPTGFFRAKTRNIIANAQAIVERHGGVVPQDMEALTNLPGVGRKTASVVRPAVFGLPGLAVDTHVQRLSRRLGFTTRTDPAKIEADLVALFPHPREWGGLSLRLIQFGRDVCHAKRPRCGACPIYRMCRFPEKARYRGVK